MGKKTLNCTIFSGFCRKCCFYMQRMALRTLIKPQVGEFIGLFVLRIIFFGYAVICACPICSRLGYFGANA